MMRRVGIAALVVFGCAQEPVAPKVEAPPQRYGEPLSNAAVVDLGTVVEAAKEHDGETIKVRGTVAKVCQKKGCWMTLGSPGTNPGEPPIRVTFKGYSFFVPKDLSGSRVLAEGTFHVKTIPEAQAQHYADDEAAAGAPVRKVTGDQLELSLVASGVEIVPPTSN